MKKDACPHCLLRKASNLGLACGLIAAISAVPSSATQSADRVYPTAEDNLPKRTYLPDPFRFYWEERYVQNLDDWKERQKEMKDLLCLVCGGSDPFYEEQESGEDRQGNSHGSLQMGEMCRRRNGVA